MIELSSVNLIISKVLEEARAKASEIENNAKLEFDSKLQEVRRSTELKANELMEAAEREVEFTRRKHLNEEVRLTRLKRLERKNKFLEEVLAEARSKLSELVEDRPRYEPILVSLTIKAIVALGGSEFQMHLNAKDLKRLDLNKLNAMIKEGLNEAVEIKFANEPISCIGGARVSSINARVSVDATLDSKLRHISERLPSQIGKILFAD